MEKFTCIKCKEVLEYHKFSKTQQKISRRTHFDFQPNYNACQNPNLKIFQGRKANTKIACDI